MCLCNTSFFRLRISGKRKKLIRVWGFIAIHTAVASSKMQQRIGEQRWVFICVSITTRVYVTYISGVIALCFSLFKADSGILIKILRTRYVLACNSSRRNSFQLKVKIFFELFSMLIIITTAI